jgi:hypothetical protein
MSVLTGNIYSPLRYLYELSVQSPVSECVVRSIPTSAGNGAGVLTAPLAGADAPDAAQMDADAAAAATDSFGIVALGAFAHLLLLLDKSEVLPLTSSKTFQGWFCFM